MTPDEMTAANYRSVVIYENACNAMRMGLCLLLTA